MHIPGNIRSPIPVIMRIKVVFPAPLGPRSPSTDPREINKLISFKAVFLEYFLDILLIQIIVR